MSGRIPVTVLSGYLGSGKTTIINRCLTQPHGLRLAVLVNDFGAVNVDARLIEAGDAPIVELANGCVCCSIGDDLGSALTAVAELPEPPEHVLLEASGVADPERIAMTVGYWPGFELDAVIAAADAEIVRKRAQDKYVGHLVRRQLASADLVVITKTDLIRDEQAKALRGWIASVSPDARLIEAQFGDVSLATLVGLSAGHHTEAGCCGKDEHMHRHDERFASHSFFPSGPIALDRLRETLEALPDAVHRIKGFVRDAETGRPMLVQCVGSRCVIAPAEGEPEPGLILIAAEPTKAIADAVERLNTCWGKSGSYA